LHHDDENDHNRRAAFLHVMGDLLGSVAALLAGAVIYFTGWLPIDSILSIFISLLILFVTLKLIKDIWNTLRHV
jgi:cobalt-zinc-cadmium efflux system protein